MLFLKYIENSFDNLSLKIKIELFIFPMVLFLILFYIFIFNSDLKQKVLIDSTSTYLRKYETHKMNKKVVYILKDIEVFAKNKNIILTTISSDNKTIELSVKAKFLRQIEFIKYLEDYNSFSKIDILNLNENELKIKINFNKFFIKNSFTIKARLENLIHKNNIKLKLKAIVSQSILINNKWLKINEMINSYKIIKIDKNNVYLKNSFETIKLKLYKNDF